MDIKMAERVFLAIASLMVFLMSFVAANFYTDIEITWGDGRGKILEGGNLLTLTMDKSSGSGFRSKREYLFARIDMKIKLIPGNSAGTVTTFYLSSQGPSHDEVDFEFLGNASGQPYTLHTNVFSQGEGNREQQFYLWFDPTADFHTYTILWNPQHIIFYVDGTAIRVFKNLEEKGVPYPKAQPMRLYSSLWDAEEWATQGGRVKTDWSMAPFAAAYRGYSADGCAWVAGRSTCSGAGRRGSWWDQALDATAIRRMDWVRRNYMVYDYCKDTHRFPQGLPTECFS